MIRMIAIMTLLLVARSVQATQDRPAPKKAEIVTELQRAFDEARAGLQKDDPGAKTRAAHRRIIEGLDKLLEQEEDKGPLASQQPASQEGRQTQEESAHPAPKTRSTDGPKSIPEVTPAQPGKGADREPSADGPWETRRKWRQDAVDAVGRERFPPSYEELLRAYYRSLAVSRGEEP